MNMTISSPHLRSSHFYFLLFFLVLAARATPAVRANAAIVRLMRAVPEQVTADRKRVPVAPVDRVRADCTPGATARGAALRQPARARSARRRAVGPTMASVTSIADSSAVSCES